MQTRNTTRRVEAERQAEEGEETKLAQGIGLVHTLTAGA